MPHVTVKLWPGKTEAQKQQLADAITRSVCSILGDGEESVSVAMREVSPADWKAEVYEPEIIGSTDRHQKLYKRPGYSM